MMYFSKLLCCRLFDCCFKAADEVSDSANGSATAINNAVDDAANAVDETMGLLSEKKKAPGKIDAKYIKKMPNQLRRSCEMLNQVIDRTMRYEKSGDTNTSAQAITDRVFLCEIARIVNQGFAMHGKNTKELTAFFNGGLGFNLVSNRINKHQQVAVTANILITTFKEEYKPQEVNNTNSFHP